MPMRHCTSSWAPRSKLLVLHSAHLATFKASRQGHIDNEPDRTRQCHRAAEVPLPSFDVSSIVFVDLDSTRRVAGPAANPTVTNRKPGVDGLAASSLTLSRSVGSNRHHAGKRRYGVEVGARRHRIKVNLPHDSRASERGSLVLRPSLFGDAKTAELAAKARQV